MKPLIDSFTPFTPDRIIEIRYRRHSAIAKFYENRAAKKTPTKHDKSSPKRQQKIQLDAKAQATLAGLDPKTQQMVLLALQNAGKKKK